MPLFVLSECIPSSDHNIVLQVLGLLRTFSAAVISTVSNCCTSFAFPSHSSPAYFSFGTITFIRIHLLILLRVSRWESVRITSILPRCVFPFPMSGICASQAVLWHLYVKVHALIYDRQFTFSPLATEIYRVRLIFVTKQLLLFSWRSPSPPIS